MSEPLFTICIPTYNSRDVCERAVDSAVGQTHGDYEVVIIDDGSTDGTWDALLRYAARPRVRLLRNERNLGMTANWQRCLSCSRGRFVAFVHHDDAASPTLLSDAAGIFGEHPSLGIVAFDSDTVANGKYGLMPAAEYARYIYSQRGIPAPSGTVFRRLEALAFDAGMRYCAEADLYLQIAAAGFDAFHSPKVNVCRPARSQSVTARSICSWEPFGDSFHLEQKWRERLSVSRREARRAVARISRRLVDRAVLGTLKRIPNDLLTRYVSAMSRPGRLGLNSAAVLGIALRLLPWGVSSMVKMAAVVAGRALRGRVRVRI